MKSVVLLFFLITSFTVSAQTSDSTRILEDSKSFINSLEEKNYDRILDLTYPVIFSKLSREQFKEKFKSVFGGNEEFKITYVDLGNVEFRVSEIYELDSLTRYAFISFPTSIEMEFRKKKFKGEEQVAFQEIMKVRGGMKVHFLNDRTVRMNKLAMIVGINDKNTDKTWKYINHDTNNPLYVKVIPIEIIKRAEDYYFNVILNRTEDER